MNENTINRMKLLDRYLGVLILYLLKMLGPLAGRKPDKGPLEIRNILLIKLWGIGNLVMILPLIRAVRRHYPQARIYFLTLECNTSFLKHVTQLNGLITIHPRGFFRTGMDLFGLASKLRKLRPDLVLDFEQFLKVTPILTRLSGATQSIGFKTEGQARSTLYNVRVPYQINRHMSLAFGDIVRCAGISTQGLPPLGVPRSPKTAREVTSLLSDLKVGDGPVVVLHPGSGDNFPGRRWPVDRFARLAERLVREKKVQCILTGTAPEKELGSQCEAMSSVPLTNTMGRLDIPTFIELLDQVDLLVTNDTAPAHIGSALGTPLIAFYGPNTPELYGPLHADGRVFYHRLPCSPCLTNMNAKTSSCRIPACILEIKPDEVFDAACLLLGTGKSRHGHLARGGNP